MVRNRTVQVILALLALSSIPARADLVFTGSTAGADPVSGTADFNIGASSLTLTLTNSSTVGHLDQVLTGLVFSFAGGSGFTLGSVSDAAGIADCNEKGSTCKGATDNDGEAGATTPFGWGLTGSGIFAGGGSFKPFGIINAATVDGTTGADCPSANGDLCNPQHNPFLIGPTVFTINFATAPTNITGVTFDWGTGPDQTSPGRLTPVPEPKWSILLPVFLLGGFLLRRNRKARNTGSCQV